MFVRLNSLPWFFLNKRASIDFKVTTHPVQLSFDEIKLDIC